MIGFTSLLLILFSYFMLRWPQHSLLIFTIIILLPPALFLYYKTEAHMGVLVYMAVVSFIGFLGVIVSPSVMYKIIFLVQAILMWGIYYAVYRIINKMETQNIRYQNNLHELEKTINSLKTEISQVKDSIDGISVKAAHLSRVTSFSSEVVGLIEKEEILKCALKSIKEIIAHGDVEVVIFHEVSTPSSDDPIGNFLLFPRYKRSFYTDDVSSNPQLSSIFRNDITSIMAETIDRMEGESTIVYGYMIAKDKNPFSDDEIRMFSVLASIVRTALVNAFLYKNVEELAITDYQTGLFTHRFFKMRLDEEFVRAKTFNQALGMMIMDIDDFKKINDTFGHTKGDEVLKGVSNIVRKFVQRETDIIARYGGDEIVAVLVGSDMDGLRSIAEDIRKTTEEELIINGHKVTLSIGGTCLSDEMKSIEDFIGLADALMYEAKRSGKNRVVVR